MPFDAKFYAEFGFQVEIFIPPTHFVEKPDLIVCVGGLLPDIGFCYSCPFGKSKNNNESEHNR